VKALLIRFLGGIFYLAEFFIASQLFFFLINFDILIWSCLFSESSLCDLTRGQLIIMMFMTTTPFIDPINLYIYVAETLFLIICRPCFWLLSNNIFIICRPSVQASSRPPQVHLAKAQAKQEAPNAVHNSAVEQPGEEVPWEAILVHRWEGRVLSSAQTHRDTGENLVPEPASKNKTSPRVGAWEAALCHGADVAAALRHPTLSAAGAPGQLSTPAHVPRLPHQPFQPHAALAPDAGT